MLISIVKFLSYSLSLPTLLFLSTSLVQPSKFILQRTWIGDWMQLPRTFVLRKWELMSVEDAFISARYLSGMRQTLELMSENSCSKSSKSAKQ